MQTPTLMLNSELRVGKDVELCFKDRVKWTEVTVLGTLQDREGCAALGSRQGD